MNHTTRRLLALPLALVVALSVVASAGAAPAATAAKAKANAIDRAFVREMIPHHRMAVEMAEMAVDQAEHTEIRSTAKAIIEAQSREIRKLRRIARRLGVKPAAMHDHEQMMEDAETLGLSMDEMGMSMDMSELDGADPFDRAFIDMMIQHHQGAIRMARAERRSGKNQQLRSIARGIIKAQAREIRELNEWRESWYGATSPAGGVPKE